MSLDDRKTRGLVDGSWWRQLSPEAMTKRAAAQHPLTRGQLRSMRGIYGVYPVVALLAVAFASVSANRILPATLFFGCWLSMHFLTLSPQRRRQLVGIKPAIGSTG